MLIVDHLSKLSFEGSFLIDVQTFLINELGFKRNEDFAIDVALNMIDFLKPQTSNISLMIDTLFQVDERNWKDFGIPSYKLRCPMMRPMLEKILSRLKFDEDEDIINIFNNQIYF